MGEMNAFEKKFVETLSEAVSDSNTEKIEMLEALCETYCETYPGRAELFATECADQLMKL